MGSRWFLALVAVALAGCYVEGTVGVTPGLSQQLTGADGTTMVNTHAAWSFGLATGLYFDVPYGGLGYSHWGSTTTSAPPGGAEVETSPARLPGSLRADVDLPVTRAFNLRLTGAYASVGSATVDATGAATSTMFPTSVNGKGDAYEADGGEWFGGVTIEKYLWRNHLVAIQGSVGVSHLSVETPFAGNAETTVPAVSQSGNGVQLRFMVMFGSVVGNGVRDFHWNTKEEDEARERYNQEMCGRSDCSPSSSTVWHPDEQRPVENCTPTTVRECSADGQSCTEHTNPC